MGLLKAVGGHRGRLLGAFGCCLLLSGAGCVLLESLGLVSTGPVFGHHNHGEKEELECVNCHGTYAKADGAGMPKRKVCILCHEGIDEEKPEEKKIANMFTDPPSWSRVTALPDDLIFSHKVHHDAKVACNQCHRGIEQVASCERAADELRVEMMECVECHAGQPLAEERIGVEKRGTRAQQVANDCAFCHREIRQDRPPASHEFHHVDRPPRNHRSSWKQLHGQVARAHTGKTKDRCELCHTESFCADCHRQEAPPSHTVFWKDRGHGVAVGFDRNSCAVCHQSDACDRCHRETEPRSHRGAWGPPRDGHCMSCHLPLSRSSSNCGLCHPAATHPSAPKRPMMWPFHAAGENCRRCHAVDLRHWDNGDSCILCH